MLTSLFGCASPGFRGKLDANDVNSLFLLSSAVPVVGTVEDYVEDAETRASLGSAAGS